MSKVGQQLRSSFPLEALEENPFLWLFQLVESACIPLWPHVTPTSDAVTVSLSMTLALCLPLIRTL